MADTISGYAARYNEPTIIAGQFREKLAPGCFSRSLRERPDVVAVLDHDTGRVLGRVSAKTLWLRDDRIGLFFSLAIDESTPSGQEARGTVKRGDVKGCSFLMSILSERWEDGGSQLPLRIIEDADLYEITLTAFPAYPTTSASLRSDSDSAQRRALAAARRRAEAAMRLRGSGDRGDSPTSIPCLRHLILTFGGPMPVSETPLAAALPALVRERLIAGDDAVEVGRALIAAGTAALTGALGARLAGPLAGLVVAEAVKVADGNRS